ncbi:MAG: hypothetical protein WC076_03075 [Terrimicrobiaceae bacterium]|jgi:hypothetical protein|nr:hypothetical protein [Terrimicrobiaceae bacterium]
METSHSNSFLTRIFRITKIACTLTVLITVTACASVGSFFWTTVSSLPIETIDSTGGKVSGTHAYESSDRLYVSGSIQKSFGRHIPYAAHVDVQLIDTAGRIIAEKQDAIDPSHPRTASSRSGRISYVTSFPTGEARKATKIIVRYHLDGHIS